MLRMSAEESSNSDKLCLTVGMDDFFPFQAQSKFKLVCFYLVCLTICEHYTENGSHQCTNEQYWSMTG